jgi:formylglycine-generating enzyme required for sulfatase activity
MVHTFWLDRFEVTVGRFRAFYDNYPGDIPQAGAGANPHVVGSGWDATWPLPADKAALAAALQCASTATWNSVAGANETLAMNCLDWYTAFAFCAWDGGRLPTEAEWNYAAAGGSEMRMYPWGSTVDPSYAIYYSLDSMGNMIYPGVAPVGSKSPKGDAKWRQADMGGNVSEVTLDWYLSPYPNPVCDDCAVTSQGTANSWVMRGGSWITGPSYLLTSWRSSLVVGGARGPDVGVRCARTP